jgi:hypothetical protein
MSPDGEVPVMSEWERSPFAMSAADQDVHEAIVALLRVLQHAPVSESTGFAIRRALSALRAEQSPPERGGTGASSGGRARRGVGEPSHPGVRPANR